MDIVSAVLDAAGRGSPTAPALAFGAGVISSVGPCAAPRYVAIVAMAGGSEPLRRCLAIIAFCGGIALGSVAIVLSTAAITRVLQWSSILYAALAVAFIAYGTGTLVARKEEVCAHRKPRVASAGGAFCLGATCALIPSSCCTPLLAGLGALGASTLAPLALVAVALGFTLGHVSALLAVAVATAPLERVVTFRDAHQALRTVSSGLLIALGCYYAVLA